MKNKTADILFCAALGLMLVICFAGLRRSHGFSFYENRSLAPRPAVTAAALWDGSFGEGLEDWLTDRAPWRETMLRCRTAVDLALRRPVVNDIVPRGDMLLAFNEYDRDSNTEKLEKNTLKRAKRTIRLARAVEGYGGQYLCAVLPNQGSYYADSYPSYLNDLSRFRETVLPLFRAQMEKGGVSYLDVGKVAESEGHPDIYSSRTDHHYSMQGALGTWEAIVAALRAEGVDISFDDAYTLKTVPNPYLGSRNRKLMGLRYNDEKLQAVVFDTPVAFERFNNGKQAEPTLYKQLRDSTSPVDYSFYMGGDIGEVVLKTHRPEKPTVLIYGESYVNALETFAFVSCDEFRSVDPRHYKDMTLAAYIKKYQPDIVIGLTDYTMLDQTTGAGDPFGETK